MTLITLLTLGIIIIKVLWIRTELRFAKERLNFEMLKTNSIEALILILQILAAIYMPLPQGPLSLLITVSGIGMYLGGFILAIWAKNVMSKSWGVPGVHHKKQDKLVTDGPFGFSRNPIYLAFIMLYFGFAIAIQSWLIILRIPLAIYFYKSAKKEEENLAKIFGKEYLDYKKRVPLFI
ncbi:MAG: isoprenylcysteine carboxylmethyltransferase family protein [Candidatus Levybacteria bacterium]|nr:isoprenylcysteine carboxylmethyltransferase family protein [Candidatus Levybacteria bacterium]